MKMFIPALRLSVVLMLLCGLAYPLLTTGVAQWLFPAQANGSLIEREGKIVGSSLLAQEVKSPGLFQPRASSANYDPTASAGSNRAVASPEYIAEMKVKLAALRQENPSVMLQIPADLVTGSGSGLDPDLSPEAAEAQIPRISQATGLSEQQLTQLVKLHTQGRQLGIFGEPRVNVTELNLALMDLEK
ncbi:potassium-transporting ATPase subunit KdpC [Paenibacillus barcinonensis]|uniref:Potassium-transporting ATPase KdpC subunit n=1 Tax=Paenibacillus barcinonensis TaxID=198119 RepID=A0A2V4VHK0_PAEBA|nr:potassium-transporting ATPase subunit KdpC [Paenibacillus barcinonensis]PYE44390.1 K+-transporting ATPase ATPase C chain [Paenibacillus barcinonensis]QKS58050.1 potassium-transporting ATPase subunit KdpC [Paenibacillus barcinonensis]